MIIRIGEDVDVSQQDRGTLDSGWGGIDPVAVQFGKCSEPDGLACCMTDVGDSETPEPRLTKGRLAFFLRSRPRTWAQTNGVLIDRKPFIPA